MEENLKIKAKEQIERLAAQLSDLESMKSEIEEEEYESLRKETLEQLEEFQGSLEKMKISPKKFIEENLKTPQIIKLFAAKRIDGLRQSLGELQRDFSIGKLEKPEFESKKAEILQNLFQLGPENINTNELSFLKSRSEKTNMVSGLEGTESVNTEKIYNLLF